MGQLESGDLYMHQVGSRVSFEQNSVQNLQLYMDIDAEAM